MSNSKKSAQLGIERWFVCGYSLGAGLTIRYAHDFAQHVYAHIFTNSNSASGRYRANSGMAGHCSQVGPEGYPQRRIGGYNRIPVHPRRARNLPTLVKEQLMEDCANIKPEGVANTLEFTNPFTSIRHLAPTNPETCFAVLWR